MSAVIGPPQPVLLVCGIAIALACACAAVALLLDVELPQRRRRRPFQFVERERDLAAALGVQWKFWCLLRAALVVAAVGVGIVSGVWTLGVLLGLVSAFGFRFAVAGRAARRRLRMERAFLIQLAVLRDRMAVGNQSLDTSLQDLGRAPGRELVDVLSPLAQGGLTSQNIVECARRSRSPIIEHASAVLLWSRTRSVDALITAIDEVLLPIGEAQAAVEEESLVTLTQQRAVAFAMAALMLFMFVSIARVESFRHFYGTIGGTLVLVVALVIFAALAAVLARITRVAGWTRWDVARMAEEEAAHA